MIQYTLFVILAPLAAVVMAVTLVFAFHRRSTPGAKSLIAYLAAVAGFLVGNALELADPTQVGTLFWAKFNYLFIAALPVTWLAFTLEYTGQKKWLQPGRFWVFVVIPALTFLFAQTTELHGLVWQGYTFTPAGPYLAIEVAHGPWFWVDGIYTYAVILSGAIILLREHFLNPAPRLYRRRTALLIAAGIFPLVFNLAYVFHLVPGWHKDYTPLAFALAGIFFALVLFRYGLLDVMPVARSLLVDELPDGMLLIDRQRRVVDLNPAARGILGIEGDVIGRKLEAVWPESAGFLAFAGEGRFDSLTRPDVMHLQRGNFRMSFSLRVMPVGEPHPPRPRFALRNASIAWRGGARGGARKAVQMDPQGWMILLTDVTRRVEAERGMVEANAALRKLNEELEERIAARTLALSERAAELEAISRVSAALRRAAGMEELLKILLDEAIANVKAAGGAIYVVEGEGLVVRAEKNFDGSLAPQVQANHQRALHQVLETRQMLRTDEAILTPIRAGSSAVKQPAAGALRVLGVLVVWFEEKNLTPKEHLTPQFGALPRLLEQWSPAPNCAPSLSSGSASDDREGEPRAADAERLLTAIAEVGSNAFQRVRAMENLEQLVQQRTRHLSTLYEVTSVTNQFMALPDLLNAALRTIRDVLGLRAVTLHLVDLTPPAAVGRKSTVLNGNDELRPTVSPSSARSADDREGEPEADGEPALYLAAWEGLTDAAARALPEPGRADSPWGQALARGGMVMLPEMGEGALSAGIGVPVRAKGRLLGVLTVLDESIGHFSAEDIALLGAVADQLGVAVDSAQLRERARAKAEEAAVMEERQRLARDLHDSVTQSLYSLVLFSEAVKDGLKTPHPPTAVGRKSTVLNGNDEVRPTVSPSSESASDDREGEEDDSIARALENLEHLREAGQQALKEMRLLIYELRPQALARDGLVGALRSRLEMVERRAGVRARLEVEGLFPLPDAVETGLFGIAQEALNNVLKHARASEVLVRLSGAGRCITLEVRDNGTGFPPGTLEGADGPGVREGVSGAGETDAGVGLFSMRERARQMGGTIAIESAPGQGTRVVASVEGVAES